MDFSYKEFFVNVPNVLRSIFYLEPHIINRYKGLMSQCSNETISNNINKFIVF